MTAIILSPGTPLTGTVLSPVTPLTTTILSPGTPLTPTVLSAGTPLTATVLSPGTPLTATVLSRHSSDGGCPLCRHSADGDCPLSRHSVPSAALPWRARPIPAHITAAVRQPTPELARRIIARNHTWNCRRCAAAPPPPPQPRVALFAANHDRRRRYFTVDTTRGTRQHLRWRPAMTPRPQPTGRLRAPPGRLSAGLFGCRILLECQYLVTGEFNLMHQQMFSASV